MVHTIPTTRREALLLPGKGTVALSLAFAELSRKDLSASRVLYERRLYPHSIFYLQQSVEKGVKSVGLLMNIVRPSTDDLVRDIGHTTVLAILAGRTERLAQLRRNLGVLAAAEELKEGKELFLRLGLPWEIPDQRAMEAKLSEEEDAREEASRLQGLKPRDLWKITLDLNPKRPPNPAILKLLDDAEAQWRHLDRFERKFEDRFSRLMTEPDTLRYVLNVYGKAFPEVAPLAFFTMWHERETRYPPVDGSDYWDPKMYGLRSGLVRLCPRLTKHARRLCEGAAAGAKAALRL